ncbi:MAG: diguanylate cyclase [Chthoniobacterales bacterium]|nr:diguanylate cyclase [Chthoniobacterales bacterium]
MTPVRAGDNQGAGLSLVPLPQRPRAWTANKPVRRLVALIALGIGLVGSLLAGLQVSRVIEHNTLTAFSKTCDEVTLRINERLTAYALLLQGGRALFNASDTVTRGDWRAYVESLRANETVPGYQGIGFAVFIRPENLEKHTAQIRGEGFPDYRVHPPGPREIYTSIVYLEPFSGRNLRAFGYDMFSEPVRRLAMERARDTGNAALSGKVRLVQEDGTDVQAGALMYVPVYRRGAALGSDTERRNALEGWVYSPYRMDDLLEGTIPELAGREGKSLDLEIFDGDKPSDEALLFDSQKSANDHTGRPSLQQERTIDFNGHRWLLVFRDKPEGGGLDLAPAWITAGAGLVITFLVFGMLLSIYRRSDAQLTAERLAVQIRGMAFHDALTKLPNRVLLRDRFDMALAAAKRSQNWGALMMVDLDNFKPLNDTHGHAAGDALLVEVARRLRGCVRETDTVARLGGDEFIVLLGALAGNEAAARKEAEAIAGKVLESLSQPYVLAVEKEAVSAIEHRCSASIGVALFTGEDTSQSEIIHAADDAMYRAKKEGRNRVCLHERGRAENGVSA